MDNSIGFEKTMTGGGDSGGFALAAGDTLGQYRIVRPLGKGGMGEVYEVEHTTLDRRYALKLLPASLDSQGVSLERFKREAKVMANLEHPNILKVDDFGETEGRYWLRMELAEGVEVGAGGQRSEAGIPTRVVSLDDLVKVAGGKLDQELLLPILRQILEGLKYAHGRGAVHRDLKPANILLAAGNGEDPFLVKISDFGLVRLVGEDWVRSQAQLSVQRSMSMGDMRTMADQTGSSEGSSTRALLGTFEYMSPEQKRGEDADERSDLYAVGVMAYRLLTGRSNVLKLPSRVDPDLVAGWDKFVEQALEEEPSERLTNAADGVALLDVVCEQIAAVGRGRDTEHEKRAAEEREKAERARRKHEQEQQRARDASKVPPSVSPQGKSGNGKKWLIGVLVLAGVIGYGIWYGSATPDRPDPVVTQQPSTLSAQRFPDLLSSFANSLGMKFAPVAGLDGVLFGVWETRVQDFREFVNDRARNNGYDYRQGDQPYVLKSDGWKPRGWEFGWNNPGFPQADTHPVTCVSWEDAQAFCEWLTRKERAEGKIAANQAYRLPRDWEWSVAVGLNESRSGTPMDKDAKTANVYPWGSGEKPPARWGNYAGEEAKNSDWPSTFNVMSGYRDEHARTSPAGHYGAKHGALCDLGGNVWEWCEDFYDGKSGARVLRGGSWSNYGPGILLSSFRSDRRPGDRFGVVGFRVVLGVSSR